jgi:hypothetical protein
MKLTFISLKLFTFLAIIFAISGCASLVHGTKQFVKIDTNPSGATISHGGETLQTPVSIELDRGSDHVITISKPGFKEEKIKITRVLSKASAASIILPGGFICMGIDALSGAIWDLEPDTLTIMMKETDHDEWKYSHLPLLGPIF